MKTRWLLTLIVFATSGILHSKPADLAAAAPVGVLKEAIHAGLSADWLDPATVGAYGPTGYFTLYLIHDALIKAMPEGSYTPCLAESWNVSSDAKVYEFKLRRGVKFHNGDAMTAEDVLFSFWRYKSAHAEFIHGRTEKAEAVNPYLVRFRFKEAFPDFLEYLALGGTTIGWVVPQKYIEKVGDAGFKRHPVGCGPYKFVEFVPGVRLVGEAFEDFWRKVPNIKKIELHIIPEPATRLAMLRRGEVDIATFMTDVFYQDVKKDPRLKLFHPLSPGQLFLAITTQWDSTSPWSDPRVRLAASLAIDRKTLADIHLPGAGPLGSFGLEGDPLMVQFPADPYDPEQAKKLLAEAGYPKGFHGGKFYPYNGPLWAYGEQITTYWKAVGISVDSVRLDRPAWLAARNGGNFKGGVFVDTANSATIGGRLGYLFTGCPYGNYPDIQALWEQYRREVSLQVRKDLIERVQRLIRERNAWIPLNRFTTPAACAPKVRGNPFKVQPLIWFTAPFEDIDMEK